MVFSDREKKISGISTLHKINAKGATNRQLPKLVDLGNGSVIPLDN